MEIRIGEPKRFRLPQVIIGSLLGGGFVIVDLVIVALALLLIAAFGGNPLVGLPVLLLLIFWLVGSSIAFVYFYPFLDSTYIRWILRDLMGKGGRESGHVWEVSLRPRLRGGLRGMLDDCDDIGILHVEDDALRFHGDSLDFSIPYSEMGRIVVRSPGARGMWILGGKIEATVHDGGEERILLFAGRSANTIPESRRITADMFQVLKYRFGGEIPPDE